MSVIPRVKCPVANQGDRTLLMQFEPEGHSLELAPGDSIEIHGYGPQTPFSIVCDIRGDQVALLIFAEADGEYSVWQDGRLVRDVDGTMK